MNKSEQFKKNRCWWCQNHAASGSLWYKEQLWHSNCLEEYKNSKAYYENNNKFPEQKRTGKTFVLTPTQAKLFNFIKNYKLKNKKDPKLTEIANYMEYKSQSSVSQPLKTLQRKNVLYINKSRKPEKYKLLISTKDTITIKQGNFKNNFHPCNV